MLSSIDTYKDRVKASFGLGGMTLSETRSRLMMWLCDVSWLDADQAMWSTACGIAAGNPPAFYQYGEAYRE